MSPILYYFYDPMCSWCYAFQPTFRQLKSLLPPDLKIEYVLGGLAPDDDEEMAVEMQQHIQAHWRRIQETVPGTQFNFDFWTHCKPRRSTYPACRAIIAASWQADNRELLMLEAIQRAYFLEARNPSNDETHIQLAEELGLDREKFEADLHSTATENEFQRQLDLVEAMSIRGFPCLVLSGGDIAGFVDIDYNDAERIRTAIESGLGYLRQQLDRPAG